MESAVLHSIFIFLFMENDFGDHGRGLGGRMGTRRWCWWGGGGWGWSAASVRDGEVCVVEVTCSRSLF